MTTSPLVSERVGQFFIDDDRLEYTAFGGGDRWVVLLQSQLVPRTMHDRLGRVLAAAGMHVVTLDLLGHGRSDRPEDPKEYSVPAWAEQVVALLDHLDAEQAVVGGTSLGANIALEVALLAPGRVRGLLLEMPVLDNAVEAGLLAFSPLLFTARFAPPVVGAVAAASRLVPRDRLPALARVAVETLDQRPRAMAAVIHGIFFGRVAPSSRQRRTIDAPALVVGHPHDPVHLAADARMLAEELAGARHVAARGVLEWRLHPDRLDAEAVGFVEEAWRDEASRLRHA